MLARLDLGLPVERQMLAELGLQNHCQQFRSGAAARDRLEWRWRLGDALAGAAGEFLPFGSPSTAV